MNFATSNERALKLFLQFFAIILFVLFHVGSLTANEVVVQSQLRGRVVDANHAAIGGAKITAARQGQPDSTTTTNSNGEFFLAIEPGEYFLKIQAKGFTEVTQIIKSRATNFEPLEIVLQPAGATAIVTVMDMGGYGAAPITSATRTLTPLRDTPQSVTVVSREVIRDQSMRSIDDVVRYVPGIIAIQGENNRDRS